MINFRTQMTASYAELGETCVATTAQLGIVIFFCCAYATAAFRTTHSDPCGAALRPVDTVMPISILRDARTSLDATLAKCRCVVARAEKRTLYHSAGVVDTRHFAKIRVSQSDLRSKINHHAESTAKDHWRLRDGIKKGIIQEKWSEGRVACCLRHYHLSDFFLDCRVILRARF